jgi:hypothetical protein
VLAQLEQDLLHCERGEDVLDEDGRADRAAPESEGILRSPEHVGPESRLVPILELRQVEVGPAAAVEKLAGVVEDVEAEVEEAPRDRRSSDLDVLLR